ncbi:MAG: sigma-70 family RNA polymerase sigma factor [Pseudomonadota bacterium]
MTLLSRKGCNSSQLGALYEYEAAQGSQVSLETTGSDPSERERLANCVEQIASARSRPAFAEVFEYFAPRLKSYLMRLGSDASGAEEIMQEVMLNVWRKAEQYDRRQASVSTWIFRIARNRRIDSLRRSNKPELDAEDPMLKPAAAEQPDITVNRSQIELKVREVIETLPEEQLVLLKAAFYEGLSHSEIAKTYGLPLGTVKSRIRLAFMRLRGSLERDH